MECPICRNELEKQSDQYGRWLMCPNCPFTKRLPIMKPVAEIPTQSDPVNHPPHYKADIGGIECIEAIKAQLGKEGFIAFLRGQVAKYNWRLGKKDAAKIDAEKAQWYMNRLVGELDENTP